MITGAQNLFCLYILLKKVGAENLSPNFAFWTEIFGRKYSNNFSTAENLGWPIAPPPFLPLCRDAIDYYYHFPSTTTSTTTTNTITTTTSSTDLSRSPTGVMAITTCRLLEHFDTKYCQTASRVGTRPT